MADTIDRRRFLKPDTATAAACSRCRGNCDTACPFGREVCSGLIDAHARLDYCRA